MLRKQLYGILGASWQGTVDRLRFRLRLLPRIGPRAPFHVPGGRRAALMVSADLELGWAWRLVSNGAHLADLNAAKTRRNLPALLELFNRFRVPAAWATVGHLLLRECQPAGGRAHPEMPRPPRHANPHWRFDSGDWYECDPGANVARAPAWYAPDLVGSILSQPVRHELACHTFSHIDCSDSHCPESLMDAELEACGRLGRDIGLRLTSFVFPANLPGNLAALKRHGFSCYRSPTGAEIDWPRRDEHGMWRLPCGVAWELPPGWSASAWVAAVKRCLDATAEAGALLHLWFHPSCDEVNVREVFPRVLSHLENRRDEFWVGTMGSLATSLTSPECPNCDLTRAGHADKEPL